MQKERLFATLFSVQFVALDLFFRGLGAYWQHPLYWLGAVESMALAYFFWTLRGGMSRRAQSGRAGRALLSLAAATIVAVEWLYFRDYHGAIDAQAVASLIHSWSDVHPVLVQMLPRSLALVAGIALAEYALLRTPVTGHERRLVPATVLVGASLLAPPMRLRTPEPPHHLADQGDAKDVRLSPLPSSRRALPSVLFILTESVRAADYCTEHVAGCDVSPEVNTLLPDRIPFRQMRSVASYTAVSFSALTTGRAQAGPRDDIARAPSLFDYLKAVRLGEEAVSVHYLSAQSESVFETMDVRASLDTFVTVESLVGHAVDDEDSVVNRGVDRLLAARFSRELERISGPAFVLLHFAGTHAPYFMNEADAPFRPWQREASWSKMPHLRNAYRNAIHEQDKSIAASIRHFVSHQGALPYVILFTSDHGESFGEHGAIHHGQNLYDEQIHVPGWISFGNGALRPDEVTRLEEHSDRDVTHLDVLPSVLDLFGVLDAAPKEVALGSGRSLLRSVTRPGPIPITNCTAMFPCPVNTWGVLYDGFELEAQLWDADWKCMNLHTGEEQLASNEPVCRTLRDASKPFFPRLPNGQSNR